MQSTAVCKVNVCFVVKIEPKLFNYAMLSVCTIICLHQVFTLIRISRRNAVVPTTHSAGAGGNAGGNRIEAVSQRMSSLALP